jgi:hypothetical protein
MSVKEDTMDKKIIHEVKLPRVITVALYAIAIGLLANVFKPVLTAHPAFAASNGVAKIAICNLNGYPCMEMEQVQKSPGSWEFINSIPIKSR